MQRRAAIRRILESRGASVSGDGQKKRVEWQRHLNDDWRAWLTALFPGYVRYPFASRHVDFWEWVWSIEKGVSPRPFIAIWPRGGAKSTNAELATIAIGLKRIRPYALYVSGTQDQADRHVGTVGGAMESVGVDRALNRYGSSRGWRRNRLRSSNGFTVDALGLDTASRGIKVDEDRPGFIVLDDIDDLNDSLKTIQKKINTLTNSVLPTGSNDAAILGVQNLIHSNSIFSQIVDGKVDFLSKRIVSGPFKAIDNFEYVNRDGRFVITGGTATWEGQSLETCENLLNTWGPRAFLRECQHAVREDREGALWKREQINKTRVYDAPEFVRVVVAIDPSASSQDTSNEAGISAVGRDRFAHGFVLGDYTLRGTPNQWALRAIVAYILHDANLIVGEGNNGGEMVEAVLRGIERDQVADELEKWGIPRDRAISGKQVAYKMVHASESKRTRAEPASMLYEQNKVHHVGMFSALEDEMVTWVPNEGRSPNRIDALVWGLTALNLIGSFKLPAGQPTQQSKWATVGASHQESRDWKKY